MRTVPPYPAQRSPAKDQMLRDLYGKVRGLERSITVIRDAETPEIVIPWITLHAYKPVRYRRVILNWNVGYGLTSMDQYNPYSLRFDDKWVLLGYQVLLYEPWYPTQQTNGLRLPNMLVMIGRNGGQPGTHDVRERDVFARGEINMSQMEVGMKRWDAIGMRENPYRFSWFQQGIEQRGKVHESEHGIFLSLQSVTPGSPVYFYSNQVGSLFVTLIYGIRDLDTYPEPPDSLPISELPPGTTLIQPVSPEWQWRDR